MWSNNKVVWEEQDVLMINMWFHAISDLERHALHNMGGYFMMT